MHVDLGSIEDKLAQRNIVALCVVEDDGSGSFQG